MAGLQLIRRTGDTRLLIEKPGAPTEIGPGAGINGREFHVPILGVIAPTMPIKGGGLIKTILLSPV